MFIYVLPAPKKADAEQLVSTLGSQFMYSDSFLCSTHPVVVEKLCFSFFRNFRFVLSWSISRMLVVASVRARFFLFERYVVHCFATSTTWEA